MRAAWAWIVLIAGCGFKSQAGQIDAAPPEHDAAGPDASTLCPASYDVTLPGPSRYRLIKSAGRAWEQSDACVADMPGATHLVVIDTAQELADVTTFVSTLEVGVSNDAFWIGTVQLNTAANPDEGWLGFDGTPMFNGWGGSEPNDGSDTSESNHEEQFVRMAKAATFFIDDKGGNKNGGLCECDGKPLAATVAAAIDSYRP